MLLPGILLMICVSGTGAWGQQEHLSFGRLGLKEGLSQSQVLDMIQDHMGYLWFATQDGLNRFDGYAIKVYRHDPEQPGSLPYNAMHSLAIDDQGTLWIGGIGGLFSYDRTRDAFDLIDVPGSEKMVGDVIPKIVPDGNGLWLGSGDSGLVYYDGRSFQYHPIPEGGNDMALDAYFLGLAPDGVWLVGNRGQLLHFSRETERFTPLDLERSDGNTISGLQHIVPDGNKGFYVATGQGVAHYHDTYSKPRMITPMDPPVPFVADLSLDHWGNFWLGTMDGLFRFNPKSGALSACRATDLHTDGLAQNDIKHVFIDRSDTLWLATNQSGLNYLALPNLRFRHYTVESNQETSLTERHVHDVLEDDRGRLWIALNAAVDRFDDGEKRSYTMPTSRPRAGVVNIHQDRHQKIWASVDSGGLFAFNPEADRFQTVPLPSEMQAMTVFRIEEDRLGRLWFGTRMFGLVLFDRETGYVDNFFPFPGEKAIRNMLLAILEDRNGVLWTGFLSGLFRFSPETGFQPWRLGERVAPRVYDLIEDGNGTLWVASQNGLYRVYPEGEPDMGTRIHGLPNENIYRLVLDRDENLWVSTNKGLARLDPRTGKIRAYDVHHGLQSNEFNYGAGILRSNGEVLFGGINGLTAFFPADLEKVHDHAPSSLLTELKIDNEMVPIEPGVPRAVLPWSLDTTDQIIITPNHYRIGFEFATPHNIYPTGNRFAYRMEGLERDWIHTDSEHRNATYTTLSPKTYTFRLKAAARDGEWGPERTLRIIILPPWWQAPFAWFLYVVLFFLLIGAVFRLKSRKLIREKERVIRFNRELEKQVTWRTEELNRRNEDLLHRNREMEMLDAIVKTINREIDFGSLIRTMMREGHKLQPNINSGLCLMYREQDDKIMSQVTIGPEPMYRDWINRSSQGILMETIHKTMKEQQDGLWVAERAESIAQIAMHLPVDHDLWGLVLLDGPVRNLSFDESGIRSMIRFREHVSTAMFKTRLLKDLADTRKDLEYEAHRAGMAELAANVLHNVGNRLNSVQTSAQVLLTQMEGERELRMMAKIAELFHEHRENLSAFLNNDPKGQQLPKALSVLYQRMHDCQENQATECRHLLESLHDALAYLSEQRTHTDHHHQFLSNYDLCEVLEDQLGARAHMFRDKGIHVIKHLQEVPSVALNRPKMQRVLSCLLENACQAVETCRPSDTAPAITITTGFREDGLIFLSIADNGCGIESDQLEKVFNQTYSTWSSSKGVGLHYCANTVNEMQGEIEIKSEGRGRGTVVILSFPPAPPTSSQTVRRPHAVGPNKNPLSHSGE